MIHMRIEIFRQRCQDKVTRYLMGRVIAIYLSIDITTVPKNTDNSEIQVIACNANDVNRSPWS